MDKILHLELPENNEVYRERATVDGDTMQAEESRMALSWSLLKWDS